MCRLLGSVSRTPVTVDEVLGGDRSAFLDLARQHGDGWGHAWSASGGLEVEKAPGSALSSPVLADLAANRPAEAGLTHLRWATLHLAVRQENTHPFTDGTVAFAHNGSIAPPAALDPLVDARLANRRQGDTDSEGVGSTDAVALGSGELVLVGADACPDAVAPGTGTPPGSGAATAGSSVR